MLRQLQLVKPLFQSYHGHLYQVGNASSAYLDILRLGLQARTVTRRTSGLTSVSGQHHAILYLVLVLLYHVEEEVDTRFFLLSLIRWKPVPEPVLLLLGQVHVRLEDGEVVFGCMLTEPVFPFAHLGAVPTNHTSVVNAQGGIGNHEFLVDTHDTTEALTLRTSASGRVKREQLVAWFLESDAVGLELHREVVADVRWREHQSQFAMSLEESGLCRIHQACNRILRIINAQTVYYKVQTILIPHSTFHIPRKEIVYPYEFAAYENSRVALQNIRLQLLLKRTTFVDMYGCHHHIARAFRILENFLYHILCGVLLNLLSAYGRVGAAYARVKQSEIFRGLRDITFCSIAMAGGMPRIKSHSGLFILPRN